MNILITGVAGLIGSRLAQWIIDTFPDAHVLGIDDYRGGFPENVPPDVNVQTIPLGLGSPAVNAVWKAFRPDYVFHFAAYAAECLSPFIRRYNYIDNVVATAEIVNACIEYGCKRLVFTSSMATYGVGVPPFSEDDETIPHDPYGVAKLACEHDIRIAGEQHGLDWCVIRPHNVYGINQNIWDPYRNVLGIWMRRALQGQTLLVYGDGLQKRAFSYVDDCLAPLWAAAVAPAASKQVINLGGAHPVFILDAAEIVGRAVGTFEIEYREPRHEVKEAYPTCQKSVDLLGYAERTPLRVGIDRMWEWARNAWRMYPQRRQQQQPTAEITKGMYSYWRT
jgi:UDP-glucose 4-epimerase